MPSPPLRTNFTDARTPNPNELASAEYNRNADLTNQAYDNAATAQTTANAAVPASGLTESVQDIVGAMVVAGTNVTKTYDDTAGTLTINSTGGGGGGDASTNTSTSVDSEIALFSGTAGKTIKRATQTGILKATSGVIGTATAGTDIVVPGGALGTPSSGNLTNCSFPANVFVTQALVDAKGDLFVGTADNTVARLPVGSNGKTLVADSTATAGLTYLYPRTISLTQPSIGGVGDNSTNNDAAWTAALAAVGNYGEIYVPPGIFRFTGVTLPSTGGVRITGANRNGKTILRNTHATNPSIKLLGTGGNFANGCTIEHLALDATAVNSGQAGIDANTAVAWTTNQVEISNMGIGVKNQISWGGGWSNMSVLTCTKGFYFTGTGALSSPLKMENVSIYNCGTGMHINTGVTGMTVDGGTIANSTGIGLLMDSVNDSEICFTGFVFENNTSYDVQIGDASNGPQSVSFFGCTFITPITPYARSVWYQTGSGPVTFDTCRWYNTGGTTTTAIQHDAYGQLVVRGAAFPNVTNYLVKWDGSYTVAGESAEFSGFESAGNYAAGIKRYGNYHTQVAATSQTLTVGRPIYVFTGTTASQTYTLPAIALHTGESLTVKNRSTQSLTVAGAASTIYDTAVVSSVSLAAGTSARFVNDGTYWVKV